MPLATIDPLLANFVDAAEHGDAPMRLILHLHGTIVSGTLISEADHIRALEEQFRLAGPTGQGLADSGVFARIADQLDQVPPDDIAFVHLRDVTFWSGGRSWSVPCWAGRLGAVDGWSLA
jgi:hypothetical protein